MERLAFDVVIVGGGAAGLRAAIAAAETSRSLRIAIVSKVYPMRSHTVSAEGGTAAVLRDYDSFDSHGFDTVKGSDFLADQDAVEFFVRRAPPEVIQMEHWGCPWSREPDGRVAVRAFGGMTVKRTVFAADKVGFHMLHTLFQTSLKYENIERLDEWFVTQILTEGGKAVGVAALELKSGNLSAITGKAVVIATGGAGRVYEFTTNGAIKTGDGMALALRAGAPLKDMEFLQFHPTCLPGTGILITEAARGEGGYLINNRGERFLKKYVPEKMELGPRDILSRSILQEIREGRGFQGPYGQYVGLDLRHLGEDVINKKLPMVRELAEEYAGIDPVHEPIPVRPGQHYIMGGVHTDIRGSTGLPGLFAAGEAACVSINGANRLGSNSLSECLVFGAEAGRSAAAYAISQPAVGSNPISGLVKAEETRIFDGLLKREGGENLAEVRTEMQHSMEEHVGIYRNGESLEKALTRVRDLRTRYEHLGVRDKDPFFNTELTTTLELDFMLDLAEAITNAALLRRESRGAHSRTDYPKRDDANFLHHSMAYRTPTGLRFDKLPVKVTKWQPAARVY
ncbi:MAG TPA: succinate dehydrogenase/fumarate reductase flavoprotein subunit [Thermoplasmata archaeon]|nr:succinate dehydrogenase/fumarate reductase flavoprotein subunit [Thermoplasmata archaeon]